MKTPTSKFPFLHPSVFRFLLMVAAPAVFSGGLRGQGSVSIEFRNETKRNVSLVATLPNQTPRRQGELAPGQSKTFDAVRGQAWSMRFTENKVFAVYRATGDARQICTIAADASLKVVVAPPLSAPPVAKGQPKGPVPGNAPANTGSKMTPAQAKEMVDNHNRRRAEVGSGRVAWSPQIAQYAQQRAETIARTKRFEHLPQGRNPYGENLAQGGGSGGVSGFSVTQACDIWYAEKAKMPRNARIMSVDLFNRGVGHYTQMVWKGSTRIGAGIAQYQQGGLTMTVVVCCYDPKGNEIGQAIY